MYFICNLLTRNLNQLCFDSNALGSKAFFIFSKHQLCIEKQHCGVFQKLLNCWDPPIHYLYYRLTGDRQSFAVIFMQNHLLDQHLQQMATEGENFQLCELKCFCQRRLQINFEMIEPLNQFGYNSRRPEWLPVLLFENWRLTHMYTQAK